MISVVVPCYNAAPFLGETIESVLAQKEVDVEIIVVDDGSIDGSKEVARGFGSKVVVLTQANRGGCVARNRGADHAQGAYLMFLDADDVLEADALIALRKACADFHGQAIGAGRWGRLIENGDWLKIGSPLPERPPNNDPILGWISGWYVPPCAMLWPRTAYNTIGGWDESLTANQDGDLILRALLAGMPLAHTKTLCASYRDHGVARISVSSSVRSVNAFSSRVRVLKKVVSRLTEQGRLDSYRLEIGRAYHRLARNNFKTDPALARECVGLSKKYAGGRAATGTLVHRVLCGLIGLEAKESLASMLSNQNFARADRKRTERLASLRNGR